MTNFKLGTHIAVERTQRNIYPTYWDFHDKLMITPYVPNAASTGSGNTFGELSTRLPGLEDRKLFAYLKARCSTRQVGHLGFWSDTICLHGFGLDACVQSVEATACNGLHYRPCRQILHFCIDCKDHGLAAMPSLCCHYHASDKAASLASLTELEGCRGNRTRASSTLASGCGTRSSWPSTRPAQTWLCSALNRT